ncbi:MAG: hypothetical protein JWR19_3594 [Pedosphaera sp.]|nr:hypothetical protein [Pedosphaera sp.]
MSNQPLNPNSTVPDDWGIARPEKPSRPTLSPAAVSLGATLMVWGLISSLIVSAFGLVVFVLALAGWIKEIRHERKS